MGHKHKEETKVLQQFVNAIREVAYGFEPLYDYTHEVESNRKERKRERKRDDQVSTDSGSRNQAA